MTLEQYNTAQLPTPKIPADCPSGTGLVGLGLFAYNYNNQNSQPLI
jgi:hypothetical protein